MRLDTRQALKARIRELENQDPLRDNDLLLRAGEYILMAIMPKNRWGSAARSTNKLTSDPDYRKRFIALALDPNVSAAEMARRLGVSYGAIQNHLDLFQEGAEEIVKNGPSLRSRDVGAGKATDYDQEEQNWLQP